MPRWQRRAAAARVTSRPSNTMRARVGQHGAGDEVEQRGLAGAVRPDDAQRLAPASSDRPTSSVTCRAPKRLLTPSTARIGKSGFLGACEAAGDVDVARRRLSYSRTSSPPTGISGACVLVVITSSNLPSFFCHWPATSGVLETFFTGPLRPVDRADDGLQAGGADRLDDRKRRPPGRGALDDIGDHLEQRVAEADRLRPWAAGRGGVAVGQRLGAVAGQRRDEGMVGRPPDLRAEAVAALAQRLDRRGEEQRLADGDDLRA